MVVVRGWYDSDPSYEAWYRVKVHRGQRLYVDRDRRKMTKLSVDSDLLRNSLRGGASKSLLDGFALVDKVSEHLDGVERATSALRVELHAPYPPARILGGLDTLNGRVVAVDEEGFPSLGEGVLELEGVLVVLTGRMVSSRSG